MVESNTPSEEEARAQEVVQNLTTMQEMLRENPRDAGLALYLAYTESCLAAETVELGNEPRNDAMLPLDALIGSTRKQAVYEHENPGIPADAPTRPRAIRTLEYLVHTQNELLKLPERERYTAVWSYLSGLLHGRLFAETFEPGYLPVKLPEIQGLITKLDDLEAAGRKRGDAAKQARLERVRKDMAGVKVIWDKMKSIATSPTNADELTVKAVKEHNLALPADKKQECDLPASTRTYERYPYAEWQPERYIADEAERRQRRQSSGKRNAPDPDTTDSCHDAA